MDHAEEREGTLSARYLIRIHFENPLCLTEAARPLGNAVAAGSVPWRCSSYGTGWRAAGCR